MRYWSLIFLGLLFGFQLQATRSKDSRMGIRRKRQVRPLITRRPRPSTSPPLIREILNGTYAGMTVRLFRSTPSTTPSGARKNRFPYPPTPTLHYTLHPSMQPFVPTYPCVVPFLQHCRHPNGSDFSLTTTSSTTPVTTRTIIVTKPTVPIKTHVCLCQNGGTCEPIESGGFQCKCFKRFTGTLCEKPLFNFEVKIQMTATFSTALHSKATSQFQRLKGKICSTLKEGWKKKGQTDACEIEQFSKGSVIADVKHAVTFHPHAGEDTNTLEAPSRPSPPLFAGSSSTTIAPLSTSSTPQNPESLFNEYKNTITVVIYNATDLNSTKVVITDLDECALGEHDCSPFADCANTVGGFQCTCRSNFFDTQESIEAGRGKQCQCKESYCSGHGSCSAVTGEREPKCACQKGYFGNQCEIHIAWVLAAIAVLVTIIFLYGCYRIYKRIKTRRGKSPSPPSHAESNLSRQSVHEIVDIDFFEDDSGERTSSQTHRMRSSRRPSAGQFVDVVSRLPDNHRRRPPDLVRAGSTEVIHSLTYNDARRLGNRPSPRSRTSRHHGLRLHELGSQRSESRYHRSSRHSSIARGGDHRGERSRTRTSEFPYGTSERSNGHRINSVSDRSVGHRPLPSLY